MVLRRRCFALKKDGNSSRTAGDKAPRLPAMLFQQLHVGDRHAPVHRLAHVVNRQQRDGGGAQGFHISLINQ